MIRFLEDRRVLYNPSELEQPRYCVQSVIEIRRFLTSELGNLPEVGLAGTLAAMRAACRKFLDSLDSSHGGASHIPDGMFHGGFQEWVFVSALGELRGVTGVLIAEMAARYDLEVEDDLASIIPGDPAAAEDSGIDLFDRP